MRDNEKIIEILSAADAFLRSQLPALLEAQPPPHTVHRYIEAWSNISNLINELGEDRHNRLIAVPHENPDSLMGALGAIERQLERLAEKIEDFEKREDGNV